MYITDTTDNFYTKYTTMLLNSTGKGLHYGKFLYLLKKETIFFFEIENVFIMEMFLQIQSSICCNINQYNMRSIKEKKKK